MTLIDAERRTALEAERSELLLRIADASERVQRGGNATPGDYIYPPIAGCAVALPTLVVATFFAARNFVEQATPNLPRLILAGCLALFVVVAAIVFLVRRVRRASRITEARNTYELAVAPMQQRLRELDELLHNPASQ